MDIFECIICEIAININLLLNLKTIVVNDKFCYFKGDLCICTFFLSGNFLVKFNRVPHIQKLWTSSIHKKMQGKKNPKDPSKLFINVQKMYNLTYNKKEQRTGEPENHSTMSKYIKIHYCGINTLTVFLDTKVNVRLNKFKCTLKWKNN